MFKKIIICLVFYVALLGTSKNSFAQNSEIYQYSDSVMTIRIISYYDPNIQHHMQLPEIELEQPSTVEPQPQPVASENIIPAIVDIDTNEVQTEEIGRQVTESEQIEIEPNQDLIPIEQQRVAQGSQEDSSFTESYIDTTYEITQSPLIDIIEAGIFQTQQEVIVQRDSVRDIRIVRDSVEIIGVAKVEDEVETRKERVIVEEVRVLKEDFDIDEIVRRVLQILKDSNYIGSEHEIFEHPTIVQKDTKPSVTIFEPALESEKFDDISRDDLFEQIFGIKPPEIPESVEVDIFLDNSYSITSIIRLSQDRSVFMLDKDVIKKILEPVIKENVLKNLINSSVDEMISDTTLMKNHVSAVFERTNFAVYLNTLASVRKREDIYITGSPKYIKSDITEALISGYKNFYARQSYHAYAKNPSFGDTSQFAQNFVDNYIESLNSNKVQPFIYSSDAAIRVGPVVAEGRYSFNVQREYEFMRNDVRAVYDNKTLLSRFVLGDTYYRTVGYQRLIKSGGAGISREYAMNPSIFVYPVSEYEIYLDNPSEITIIVNGLIERTISLEAGSHMLKNFALNYGENDVIIEIRDIYGRLERVNFNFYHDRTFLAKSKSDYSLFYGYPSSPNRWDYDYNFDTPVVSGYYLRGLTNRFNAGLNAQYYSRNTLLGLDTKYATKYALLGFEPSLSLHPNQSGLAIKVTSKINYKTDSLSRNTTILNSAELFTENFAAVTDTFAYSATGIRLSSRVSTPINNQISGNVGFEYAFMRTPFNTYNIFGGLNIRISKSLGANARVSYQRDTRGHEFPSITLNANWFLSAGKHFLSAGESLQKRNSNMFIDDYNKQWFNYTNLSWDYRSSYSQSDYLYSSAGVILDPFMNTVNTKAGYRSSFGIAELNYSNFNPTLSSNPINQNRLNADLKTALVFANSSFGVSRPVTNSFIMVKPNGEAKNEKILINPGFEGYSAASFRGLPAVNSEINQYSQRIMVLEIENKKTINGLEKTQYDFFTGYKTGHVLNAGNEKKILVFGTISINEETPLKSTMIEIEDVSGKKELIRTFTSSNGRFTFPALAKSDYTIWVNGKSYNQGVLLEIGDIKDDYYDAGEVLVE